MDRHQAGDRPKRLTYFDQNKLGKTERKTSNSKMRRNNFHISQGVPSQEKSLDDQNLEASSGPATNQPENDKTDRASLVEEAMNAVELQIEMPDSKQGHKKFIEKPVAYFCQAKTGRSTRATKNDVSSTRPSKPR